MKKDYLIIDRAKWRSGGDGMHKTGRGYVGLMNDEGFMCCLGFRCKQMGIPSKMLIAVGTPTILSNSYNIPDLIDKVGNDTDFTSQAVKINDNTKLSPEQREKAITEHFKKIGVTVEFKGRYKKSKV